MRTYNMTWETHGLIGENEMRSRYLSKGLSPIIISFILSPLFKLRDLMIVDERCQLPTNNLSGLIGHPVLHSDATDNGNLNSAHGICVVQRYCIVNT